MKNNINNNYDLKQLLDALGVTLDQLQSSVRTQRLSDARAMFAAALMQQPGMSQQKVARILHTTQPGVCIMLQRHERMMLYAHYRAQWNKISSLVISTGATSTPVISTEAKRSGEISDKQIINN